MAHWYTADTHFHDDGIRRFFRRPFASNAEMDAALIERANARIGPDDDFWILGDFAFCEDETSRAATIAAFDRLPGR